LQITSLPEFADQIKNKRENNADNNGCHQREIKSEISFPEKNISGKFADERNSIDKQKKNSDQHQHRPNHDQHFPNAAVHFIHSSKINSLLILDKVDKTQIS